MSVRDRLVGADGVDWPRLQIPVVGVVLAAVPLLLFSPGSTYVSRLFILMLIFTLLAMALNVVFGHTDQLYLFLGAIAGISAYSTMILATSLDVSPWLPLVPSALAVGLIGALVSYVAARRRFTVIIIAILTLSLQLATVEVFVGARQYTGGTTGLRYGGLDMALFQDVFGLTFHGALYYFLLALLLGVLAFYLWLRRSKYGLAFEMIRQDDFAAEATGVNVVRYKTLAGFVGAFLVGIVGPFYGQLQGLILPSTFEFVAIDVSVLIILMIGGLRTMLGPLIGAGILIYLQELLHAAGQWQLVIFGALLVVLFLFFRQGIVPSLYAQLRRVADAFDGDRDRGRG